MSFATERQHIETRLETLWDSDLGPVLWDNAGLEDIPDPEEMHGQTGWIRPIILNSTGRQLTLGATPTHRWEGTLSVDCFAPEGKGSNAARVLADKVSEIFTRASFNTIRCRTATVTRIGVDPEAGGQWYMINVTVPFIRDETS